MRRYSRLLTIICVLVFSLAVEFAFAGSAPEKGEGISPEVTGQGTDYKYEKLREMAKSGVYDGEPAKGHSLAFANLLASVPFCSNVEKGIIKQWEMAGGSVQDIIVLDNAWDASIGIQNADIILSKKPEVWIQYQWDNKVNAMVGRKAEDMGIYVIAVDIPVPGFPYMGVDNYGTGALTGTWAADQVEKIYGGWGNVDHVFLFYDTGLGDTVNLRIWGTKDVFIERFGDTANPDIEGSKVTLINAPSTSDSVQKAMADHLPAFPKAQNIIIACINDIGAAGAYAAADIAGRWDPDKWLVLSQGVDDLGLQLIREGVIDGDSAYFPEKYGEWLVPAALAHIYGDPVPAYMFIDNVIITKDNIDQYYSK